MSEEAVPASDNTKAEQTLLRGVLKFTFPVEEDLPVINTTNIATERFCERKKKAHRSSRLSNSN